MDAKDKTLHILQVLSLQLRKHIPVGRKHSLEGNKAEITEGN